MADKKNETSETENRELSTIEGGKAGRSITEAVLIGDGKYKVKQQVNVPVLKHDSGQTVAVRIELPIRTEISRREDEVTTSSGEVIKGVKESNISVVRVTELNSGLLFNLVLNAITASEFARAYPDNEHGVPGYVGKCFAIQKLGTVAGKRYKDVNILELEEA